jgi:hypothetical protein
MLGSAAVVLVLAAACSSFGTSDSSATPDASGAEATTADATDAADAGVFLSENFDDDRGGCGGAWSGVHTDSVARIADAGTDGSFGCKICSSVTLTSYFGLTKSLGAASGPPKGGYLLEMNMRVESGGAEVGAAFSVDGQFSPGMTSSAAGWQHVTHLVSPEAGAPLTAEASGRIKSPPSCVVVDDIVVRKVD